jgi:two-component system, LuxR family, response regulator FixJ
MAIALVEDDEEILRSLSMLLESRGFSVWGFSSAERFLEAMTDEPPECVVSDIRMPGMTGLELQKEIHKRDAAVPVILITGHGDIAMAVRAINEGAFDFIEKPFNDERLMESLSKALQKGKSLRIEQDERALLVARFAELSPRQAEVMLLVAEGLSNKEIAFKLEISPRTVENYRAWVMEKMHASNLADLVRKVIAMKKVS